MFVLLYGKTKLVLEDWVIRLTFLLLYGKTTQGPEDSDDILLHFCYCMVKQCKSLKIGT